MKIVRIYPSTKAKLLIIPTVLGMSLALSSCTTQPSAEPSADLLRPAPAVGDPLPSEVFDNVPEVEDRNMEASEWQFLYRTQDEAWEYYRGPETDGICLTSVEIGTERFSVSCTTGPATDFRTGNREDGENFRAASISDTKPDENLGWVSPVEGFWVVDVDNAE
jgi:hypothetical protein